MLLKYYDCLIELLKIDLMVVDKNLLTFSESICEKLYVLIRIGDSSQGEKGIVLSKNECAVLDFSL